MNPVSKRLASHYSKKFAEHGPTARGVDWGKESDVQLRYDKMLNVIEPASFTNNQEISLLDVGSGYGGLLQYAKTKNIKLHYSGIDLCQNMIDYAKKTFKEASFFCEDILRFTPQTSYDYVVCNGILTQKLTASQAEMDSFAEKLICKMFSLCSKGIAFNVMTTKVNFMVPNLYYRDPVNLFSYCFSNVSHKIKIDHTYPLYEYTIYLYRDSASV